MRYSIQSISSINTVSSGRLATLKQDNSIIKTFDVIINNTQDSAYRFSITPIDKNSTPFFAKCTLKQKLKNLDINDILEDLEVL